MPPRSSPAGWMERFRPVSYHIDSRAMTESRQERLDVHDHNRTIARYRCPRCPSLTPSRFRPSSESRSGTSLGIFMTGLSDAIGEGQNVHLAYDGKDLEIMADGTDP